MDLLKRLSFPIVDYHTVTRAVIELGGSVRMTEAVSKQGGTHPETFTLPGNPPQPKADVLSLDSLYRYAKEMRYQYRTVRLGSEDRWHTAVAWSDDDKRLGKIQSSDMEAFAIAKAMISLRRIIASPDPDAYNDQG